MKLKQTDLIYKGKTHVLSGFGKVEKPDGRKKNHCFHSDSSTSLFFPSLESLD